MRTEGLSRRLVFFVSALTALPAAADTVVLTHGGQISGASVTSDDSPDENCTLNVAPGITLTLAVGDVQEIQHQEQAELQYARIAPTYGNTSEAQWQLATWCGQHGLDERRQKHLARVIQLDPDHASARYALGYGQYRGQWLTRKEVSQHRGLQPYDSRWRLPQEIQLLAEEKALAKAERNWRSRLLRWRTELVESGSLTAGRSIAGVRDPLAVTSLAFMVRRDRLRQPKLLYVEALGAIQTAAARHVLAECSLQDPDVEVFHACLRQLVAYQRPDFARMYLPYLKDDHPGRRARAAVAMRELGDRSMLSPLIDALVTRQAIVPSVRPISTVSILAQPNELETSAVSQDLPSSTAVQPTVDSPTVWIANLEVLETLVVLSGGANFGYDVSAWRAWLATQQLNSSL